MRQSRPLNWEFCLGIPIGKLDLRGCRESLLKRWSMKGFVDIGLIQEHFKKSGTPLFDLFGPSWWNLSSGAVGGGRGRRSR